MMIKTLCYVFVSIYFSACSIFCFGEEIALPHVDGITLLAEQVDRGLGEGDYVVYVAGSEQEGDKALLLNEEDLDDTLPLIDAEKMSYSEWCRDIYAKTRQWVGQTMLYDSSGAEETFEDFKKEFFGDISRLLMGMHDIDAEMEVYGERELSDNVRVTYINGILNREKEMLESLRMISDTHGGVRVYSVFRPTQGWTVDIIQAIMIKTLFNVGFRSHQAKMLAEMWKELIAEMGGVDGGGTIVHYAHSLGGSDTDRARSLLTPEEQRMIRVITFGSPTLMRNEGYQSVINIASKHDGVPYLDVLGQIRNYFDPNANVCFVTSKKGWAQTWRICDHLFDGETYKPILEQFGEKFLREFG